MTVVANAELPPSYKIQALASEESLTLLIPTLIQKNSRPVSIKISGSFPGISFRKNLPLMTWGVALEDGPNL